MDAYSLESGLETHVLPRAVYSCTCPTTRGLVPVLNLVLECTPVPVNTKTGLESSGQLVFFVVLEYLGIDDVASSPLYKNLSIKIYTCTG